MPSRSVCDSGSPAASRGGPWRIDSVTLGRMCAARKGDPEKVVTWNSRMSHPALPRCGKLVPFVLEARVGYRSGRRDGAQNSRERFSFAAAFPGRSAPKAQKKKQRPGWRGGNTQAAVRTKRQQTGRRGGTPSTCCLATALAGSVPCLGTRSIQVLPPDRTVSHLSYEMQVAFLKYFHVVTMS
jgi:hypothetical protein